MLFDDAQSYTAFKSSCRLSQSVTSPTLEYSLVLSAKLTSFVIFPGKLIVKHFVAFWKILCAYLMPTVESIHGTLFQQRWYTSVCLGASIWPLGHPCCNLHVSNLRRQDCCLIQAGRGDPQCSSDRS